MAKRSSLTMDSMLARIGADKGLIEKGADDAKAT